MPMCVYEKVSGRWLRGSPAVGGVSFDPATEGVVELEEMPDFIRDRHDAASPTRCRPATIEEQGEAAGAALDVRTNAASDTAEVRAMVEFVLRRTLGHVPTAEERAAARDQYRAILRAFRT